jgi:hypothetical protein
LAQTVFSELLNVEYKSTTQPTINDLARYSITVAQIFWEEVDKIEKEGGDVMRMSRVWDRAKS